jgi:outer membrane protein OmpA-like peptidoglycan-associated protein
MIRVNARLVRTAVGAAVITVALLGCQTVKPALSAPADSAVQVEKSGFSPAAATGLNAIEISLLFGNGESIKIWRLDVVGSGVTRRSWSGDSAYLPASLTWDGKSDSGALAPEGTYTAKLSIEYAGKYIPAAAESRSFLLDITPPEGTIAISPDRFTPTEGGSLAGPVTLTITASSTFATMDAWSMDVLDAAGGLVANWSGQWPKTAVTWDGASLSGGTVVPGLTYRAVATVRDVYGNSSQLKADIAVAARTLTSPAVAAQPEPVQTVSNGHPSIAATSLGFSPNGDQVADSLTLALDYGRPSSVVSWKVSIALPGSAPLKSFSGDASNMPARLVWDGKSDDGSLAAEGSYVATLALSYGATSAAATSAPFILDITPPTGSVSLSASLFSPIESSDTISLKVSARSPLARIDSWSMDILDPEGNVFNSFTSKWPADTAVWNGRNTHGELVQSAEDYPVVVRIRDQFGNVGTVKSLVPVDILVEKTPTGYRIVASRIFFKAFTADYQNVAADLAAQNGTRLDALAAKLKKFPGYKIRVVGHAVMINWDKPDAGRIEQTTILVPLSKARADAVEAALVERGLEKTRFTTEGVGASDQLVPDSDYKNRWENRRVALFLDRQ